MATPNKGTAAAAGTSATAPGKSDTLASTATDASTNTVEPSRAERFKRVVPFSYYVEEEARFGPLASHWEIGIKNGKKYFVK